MCFYCNICFLVKIWLLCSFAGSILYISICCWQLWQWSCSYFCIDFHFLSLCQSEFWARLLCILWFYFLDTWFPFFFCVVWYFVEQLHLISSVTDVANFSSADIEHRVSVLCNFECHIILLYGEFPLLKLVVFLIELSDGKFLWHTLFFLRFALGEDTPS